MLPPTNNYESADAVLKPLALDDAQRRHAALWACEIAGRGLDVRDPLQRQAAAHDARPVLEALGLVGDDAWRKSRGTAKTFGAAYLHGTEAGVKHHTEAGTRLCKPCQRWTQVEARKNGAILFMRPPAAGLRGLCGTHRAWLGHLADGETLDPVCTLYAEWLTATKHHREYSGPLAAHTIGDALPLHFDGTPCAHRVDNHGNAVDGETGCTGRAGWLLSCTCGYEQPLATQDACHHMKGEHRRQVILRALAEAN